MGIYTKKGDRGETSMFEPDPKKRCRVSKASLRVQAIGAIDEVNSYLGVANSASTNDSIVIFIKEVQRDLFQIGSILSLAPLKLDSSRIKAIETKIDEIEGLLPPLRNFVMPEGSPAAVHFMYARALARRAERRVVTLHNRETVHHVILEYVNRLSDLLFMFFRLENYNSQNKETLWIGREKN